MHTCVSQEALLQSTRSRFLCFFLLDSYMGKYVQVTDREEELLRRWKKDGRSLTDMMALSGRSRQTIIDHTNLKKKKGPGSGRPKKLSDKDFKKLNSSLIRLQKKSDCNTEITIKNVIEAASIDVSERVALDLFHDHGVWFRPLREKPVLTEGDIIKRRSFCDNNKTRSEEQWVERPNAIIDNKNFPLYLNAAGRNEASRRTIRGGFRARGAGPQPYLVKRKKGQRYAAPSVQVTAAVVKGRIRMFEFVNGRWNGAKAAAMYKGPLLRAMTKAFPEQAARKNVKWTVLEDNDPAGYKSSAGKDAKKQAKIVSMDLPPRSPDLNVLDYSLWAAINTTMRKQERGFHKKKKETKETYMARLRKTALKLSAAVVAKAVKDMYRRVRLVSDARGGLIVE